MDASCPADDVDPDPAYCEACSATGEYPAGRTCSYCNGRGVALDDLDDLRLARDEDAAEWRADS